jgi:hypothetical protein
MKLIPLLSVTALLLSVATFAQTPAAKAMAGPAATPPVTANPPTAAVVKPPSAQQEKMKSCNAEAGTKQLKGGDRQTFMKGCLSAKPAMTADATTPQQRMKTCNAQAGTDKLSGDARKSFMSNCLKAK